MIRDTRKDKKYFDAYIAYQTDRISKKTEKISTVQDDFEKKDRINLSLIKYKVDMLIAQFSVGADAKRLEKYLKDAVNTACDMQELDYESALVLMSISVMLSNKELIKKISESHKAFISEDKLLNMISVFAESGKVVWEGKFIVPKVFDGLENIWDSPDKEEILVNYLFGWYDNRKDVSWYEADKRSNDTYVGYWSFESAALAKIFSISENKLKQNIFYPKV